MASMAPAPRTASSTGARGLTLVDTYVGAAGVLTGSARLAKEAEDGIPQLLGDDRGTILPNTSAAAIAQALTDFEGHRSAFAAASARLRAFVLTEHDVDKNAARLLGLYGSLR